MKYLSAVCILWLVGCSATSQVPAERTTQTALDSLDGAATSYEARWQPKRLSAGTGSSTVAETIVSDALDIVVYPRPECRGGGHFLTLQRQRRARSHGITTTTWSVSGYGTDHFVTCVERTKVYVRSTGALYKVIELHVGIPPS